MGHEEELANLHNHKITFEERRRRDQERRKRQQGREEISKKAKEKRAGRRRDELNDVTDQLKKCLQDGTNNKNVHELRVLEKDMRKLLDSLISLDVANQYKNLRIKSEEMVDMLVQ